MWRAIVRYFQRLGLYFLLFVCYISGGYGNIKIFRLAVLLVVTYVCIVLGLNWKYRKSGRHAQGRAD